MRHSYLDKQPGRGSNTCANFGEPRRGAVTTRAPKGSPHVGASRAIAGGVTKAGASPPDPAEPTESRTGNGGSLESRRTRLLPGDQAKLKIPPRGSGMLHAGTRGSCVHGMGVAKPHAEALKPLLA